MLTNEFLAHLSSDLGETIINSKPLSGGDISAAFKITTKSDTYFVKINSNSNAQDMFVKEQMGLQTIGNTNTIKTPKVYACNIFNGCAYLILQFIDSKTPSANDYAKLAQHLALLHQTTSDNFGLDYDNYIGKLNQSNKRHSSWVDFYIQERLQPQIKYSIDKKLLSNIEVPSCQTMEARLTPLLTDVKPTLIHGDLWSGNYIISANGIPYLIDSAIYYGHADVDIAMSRLFGGFTDAFYDTYHEINPKTQGHESRIMLYQLYYLLVHLNMFGSSYYPSVKRILNSFFQ